MDSSTSPEDAPPGYTELAATSAVPYGQSTLLHADDNAGQTAAKLHHEQPGPGPTEAPYPPVAGGPSQYPGPPPPGYEPYAGPAYGYPMGPGYAPPPGYGAPPTAPPPPQQQQQQSVVVVTGQQQRGHVLISHVQSYAGHIVLACFVTWYRVMAAVVGFHWLRHVVLLLPVRHHRIHTRRSVCTSYISIHRISLLVLMWQLASALRNC